MKLWILLAIAMVPAQGQTPKPGSVQFLPQSQVQQSFVPAQGCLSAVEVSLIPGNPGPQTSVTLKIMDGTKVLTSKSKQVLPDFHGDLRFDFPKALKLTPGQSYWLRLEETFPTFFWLYDARNPYPDGEAWFGGHALIGGDGDFRFKLFDHCP